MDEREIMAIIENILFVSGEAVELKEIAKALDISKGRAVEIMEKMVSCFDFERRGLQIIQTNEKYQLATRPQYASFIQKFVEPRRRERLSQAALETLAIIAYRQPTTRMDIEEIRGVKCDHILNGLLDKGLIKDVDRLDAPGRPILYGTTEQFLKQFGLKNIEDLPPLDINKYE